MLYFWTNAYAFWRARIIARMSCALSEDAAGVATGADAVGTSSSSSKLDTAAGAALAAGAGALTASSVDGVEPAGAATPDGR